MLHKRSYYLPLISISPVLAFCLLYLMPLSSDWADFYKGMLWGICILEAFIGFGWLLCSLILNVKNKSYLYCPVGIGLLCFLGSILNYSDVVSPLILVSVIVTGCGFFAFAAMHPIDISMAFKQTSNSIGVCAVAAILMLMVYFISFGDLKFNIHDDYHAYLVGPVKILQVGSLGVDPFSERRLVSGYGGNAMLLAFMLAGSKIAYLHVLDWGIGKVALICTIFLYALRVQSKQITIFLILGVIFILPPAVNLTVIIVPMILILGSWLLISDLAINVKSAHSSANYWKFLVILSLMLSGLISLKTSFIPLAFITFLLYGYFLGNTWGVRLLQGMSLAALTALLIVFWALDLYLSSQTLLYPLLGKGVHGSVYGNFSSPTEQFFTLSHWRQSASDWIAPYKKTVTLLAIAFFLMKYFWAQKYWY